MRLVEVDYAPVLIIGIRTGGLTVATAMAATASSPLPVLPLTCRRVTTGAKSRVPFFRAALSALPRSLVDMLRRIEHRVLTRSRVRNGGQQEVDQSEATAIADHVASLGSPARILVADDAVDSGTTLATVLRTLREVCPPGSEIRSAAITQTLEAPIARPDYVLFRGTLCRFPWSFDAAA
jgi:hypoxanthine phosphoribosyltransferase